MWDADRWRETLHTELSAARSAQQTGNLLIERARALEKTLRTLLDTSLSGSASPTDPGAFLAAIDTLRHHAVTLTANHPEWWWPLWPTQIALYEAVAEQLANHSRSRHHLAVAFERIAWGLHQAFLWFWQHAIAIPEALWNALYRLFTVAHERRVLWKRVDEPLSRDGKASAHEWIAGVVALFVVDPSRHPEAQWRSLADLIGACAPFLQIVPQSWLVTPPEESRYGFSPQSWSPPRLRDPSRESETWFLDSEACLTRLSALLTRESAEGDVPATPPEAVQTLLQLLRDKPKERRQPRETGYLEPIAVVGSWGRIYALLAGRSFGFAAVTESSHLRSQRISLFGSNLEEGSHSRWQAQDLWRLWDRSANGWQVVHPHEDEEQLPLTPQQLVVVVSNPDEANVQNRAVLARVRWRLRFDRTVRVGIERFPYDRLQPIAARPWSPIGKEPHPWSPAFLLLRNRGDLDPLVTLVIPLVADELPLHWEIREGSALRSLLLSERYEHGADYLWFSFSEL